MPIDFFASELDKIYARFNQTFGKLRVCHLVARQRTMVVIIYLGMLERKIAAQTNKDAVREEIRRFIRTRNNLNRHFDAIERSISHVERPKSTTLRTNTPSLRDRRDPLAR